MTPSIAERTSKFEAKVFIRPGSYRMLVIKKRKKQK